MKRILRIAAFTLIFLAIPAFADVQTFQVTIGASGNTPIIPSGAQFICRWVVFQNNATHTMRIGDKSTSTVRGMLLVPGTSFYDAPQSGTSGPPNANLTLWYVAGTSGDKIDVTCESGQ
jgi:hypothetical protein